MKARATGSVSGLRAVASFVVTGIVVACSTHPSKPTASVAHPVVLPSASATPSGTGASSVADAGSASVAGAGASSTATPVGSSSPGAPAAGSPGTVSVPADLVDQSLLKRGYKPGLYQGKVYYCKATLTPEHFREDRCYTADQIKAMDRSRQGIINHLMTPGTCQGFGCR